MKDFTAFAAAMRARESSGNYRAKNAWGFLGAYQFGMPRLCDLGLTERVPGSKGFAAKHFRWRPGHSEEAFLSSPDLQDACFETHAGLLAASVLRRYPKELSERKVVSGVPLDVSGGVGVCHLLGEGGLKALIQGVDRQDALGTKASHYLKLFAGYELGPDLLDLASFKARYVKA